MKKSKGAVTVFLIIVLFSTVLLGGFFIDASRVLLAKRVVHNAADSAARSALSMYDKNMASEYGLFAVKDSTAQEAFKRYFKTNIKLSQNDGFDILSLDVQDDNIQVTVSSPIKNQDVAMDQMFEYSKYRALVDSSIGIMQKFSGIFNSNTQDVTGKASSSKQLLENLKSNAVNRVSDAKDCVQNIQNIATNSWNSISGKLDSGETISEKDLGFSEMDQKIADAKAQKVQLEEQLAASKAKQEENLKSVESAKVGSVTYYDDDGNEVTAQSSNETVEKEKENGVANVNQQVQDEIDKLDKEINNAETKLNQDKEKIRKQLAVVQQCQTDLQTAKNALTAAEAEQGVLKNQKTDESTKPFTDYIYDLNNAKVTDNIRLADNLFQAELDIYIVLFDDNKTSKDELEAQKKKTIEAGKAVKTEVDNVNKDITNDSDKIKTKKAEQDEELSAVNEHVKELKDAVQKAQDKLDVAKSDLKDLYSNCSYDIDGTVNINIPQGITSSASLQFANKLNDTLGFISQMKETIEKAVTEMNKTDDVEVSYFQGDTGSGLGSQFVQEFGFSGIGNNVWSLVDDLYKNVKGIVSIFAEPDSMDDAYFFTNYVFSTHTYLTSQTNRGNRHFQLGEVEYILQDSNSQLVCIAHSLRNVALLRLTINWVTYMVESVDPEWISRIISTIAKALLQTLDDMVDMLFVQEGDSAPGCALAPNFKQVKLSYSDHLRLSMMLRAVNSDDREQMFKRMLTLMQDTAQTNSWSEPSELNTRLRGEVTVDVDLVMLTLPLFESVLPKDNAILQNGKFLVHETVDMGY
jgi:hypothetical protein